VRAGDLSDEQLKTIKSVDKVRKEQRKQTIESDPGTYGTLLAGGDGTSSVLDKAQKRRDIIQYILVLATDLVTGRTISCLSSSVLTTRHRRIRPGKHHPGKTRSLQAISSPSQQLEQPG